MIMLKYNQVKTILNSKSTSNNTDNIGNIMKQLKVKKKKKMKIKNFPLFMQKFPYNCICLA